MGANLQSQRLRQLFKQRLGFLQIRGIEPLDEPAVDGGEEIAATAVWPSLRSSESTNAHAYVGIPDQYSRYPAGLFGGGTVIIPKVVDIGRTDKISGRGIDLDGTAYS